MRLRTIGLISTLALGLSAAPLSVEAQKAEKVYRIGQLANTTRINRSGREYRQGRNRKAYRQALHELGYVEGQNIVFEWRFSERKHKRLPALANELVRLKVDVLFAHSLTAALAAKNATKTIPIVFLSSVDPVAAGLVDNLARPGENLTGLTHIMAALAGKRLELLKETIPKLSRVAVLWQPGNPGSEQIWKETQLAAPGLGLQLYSMAVTSDDQLEGAFQEATKAGSTALALTARRETLAVELAIKYRLPAIYSASRYVLRYGGLMSYAVDRFEQYRRAATYVDKILKGAKPRDLPVEGPTKFELVINLKTATKLGLTIPPDVLYRADKVIK